MSEELDFHGNQLIQLHTVFVVGNILGLLPFIYLFPRVPMHYLVPTLDLLWGLFTLLQYRAESLGELMAYRFLVALFEVRLHVDHHYLHQSPLPTHCCGSRSTWKW